MKVETLSGIAIDKIFENCNSKDLYDLINIPYILDTFIRIKTFRYFSFYEPFITLINKGKLKIYIYYITQHSKNSLVINKTKSIWICFNDFDFDSYEHLYFPLEKYNKLKKIADRITKIDKNIFNYKSIYKTEKIEKYMFYFNKNKYK